MPLDTDHDGMPDAYETANGFNPNDAADRATLAANGYANLENYLNGLAASTVLATAKATSAPDLLQAYPQPRAHRAVPDLATPGAGGPGGPLYPVWRRCSPDSHHRRRRRQHQ